MQLELSDGRIITITPPTGLARIKAQNAFGARFKALATTPPTDDEAQRKVITRLAWALARYTTLTPAELVEIITANAYDGAAIVQAALTQQVEI